MASSTFTPVLAPSLESYFVDKDTGLPLAGGLVYTYSDSSRSTPKPLYTLTGNPPSYTYTALPNPCPLTANGTFSDGAGNDIIPYYFPYTGTPSSPGSAVDNYYIVVKSATGVQQFTRQGWPNASAGSTPTASNLTNYIPNGQFLTHNAIAANPLAATATVAGQITQATTNLAQGGWVFRKTVGFTSIDIVTFVRHITQISGLPPHSPRYSLQYARTNVGGGDQPILMVQFPDVNKFSDTNNYTFGFVASSTSPVTVTFSIIQNFGSGGSTEISNVIGTFNIDSTKQVFSKYFQFPNTTGNNVGPNNDDYVALAITFASVLQQVTFDDFILTNGQLTLTSGDVFPTTTNAEMFSLSLVPPVPKDDGSDLYLPLKMTQTGIVADHSEVGQIVAMPNLSNFSGSLSTNSNLMLADGSAYPAAGYSSLGIPYSRLSSVYLSGGGGTIPQFGTGANFATAYIEAGASPAQKINLSLNKTGGQTVPADGATLTNFVFTPLILGSSGYGVVAYASGNNYVTAIETTIATQVVTTATATGPLAVSEYRNAIGTYHAFNITTAAASALAHPGSTGYKVQFFTGANVGYYIWFKITNETSPGGTGTAIQLQLDASMSAADVAIATANALSGFQQYLITCGAASTFTNGAYFTFTANGTQYAPYYIIDGVSNPPAVSAGTILIPVSIASTATAAQVASATQVAINSYYFAVPNLAGLTLRGADPTGEWDIDYIKRFSLINTLSGGAAGSFELDQIYSHKHTTTIIAGNLAGQGSIGTAGLGTPINFPIDSAYTGGSESRPVNMAVNWAIRY